MIVNSPSFLWLLCYQQRLQCSILQLFDYSYLLHLQSLQKVLFHYLLLSLVLLDLSCLRVRVFIVSSSSSADSSTTSSLLSLSALAFHFSFPVVLFLIKLSFSFIVILTSWIFLSSIHFRLCWVGLPGILSFGWAAWFLPAKFVRLSYVYFTFQMSKHLYSFLDLHIYSFFSIFLTIALCSND